MPRTKAHQAVTTVKEALYAANYHCPGEAAGIVEAFFGPGRVPVLLVQTYNDAQGVEVWQPVHHSIKTSDTLEALKLATTPAERLSDLVDGTPEEINATIERMNRTNARKPNPDECVRLCEVLAAFWGDGVCDAPINPGAYLTEEDTPICDLIRAAVGWRKP